MTRPYEFEIEVRPVVDDDQARRVLEKLRGEGLSVDDDNYCQTDDSRGHVFQGMTELSGGVLPEDVHQSVAKTLGPGVQVTSRWRDLDPSYWDEEFGPAGRATEESAGENEQIAEVPEDRARRSEYYFFKAMDIVAETQQVSISMIQRRLRIGYKRAAQIVERMAQEGMISPAGPLRRK